MDPTVELDDSKPQIFRLTRVGDVVVFYSPAGAWAGRVLRDYDLNRWCVHTPKSVQPISKTFATAWGAASALAIRWREADPDYDRAPMCGRCLCCELDWRECESCDGEGVDGHDCGEDCCACAYPEDNVRCDSCSGKGGFYYCACNEDGQHSCTKCGELGHR